MVDENLLGIWLFILALTPISTASIVEGPVDTLAITGFDAQLNCTINDTVGQPVTWECSECTVTPITVYTTSLYPDKYEVIFVAGLLESYHLRVLNTTTDDESTYQCSILTIDDAAASLTILTSGPLCVVTPSTFVIEDEEATLTCAVEKGVPPGELVWYREGVVVSRDGASTRHELNLVFTREDNGTSFTCTLEDETLPPQTEDLMTCADDVVIIVQYTCTVSMTVEPVNNNMEGDDVTIHCSSHDGYPDPYKMGLTFNSEEVIEVYGTEINHTIENISRSQSGTYECFAVTRFYDNSEQRSSAQHDIIVNYPASVTHVGETEHKVEIGDSAVLKCAADGVPQPSITWYDGASDVIQEGDDDNLQVAIVGDGTVVNSSLTLTLATESYYGTYTCEAFNFNQSGGSQTFNVTRNKVTDDPVSLGLVLGVVGGVILVTLVSLVILYLVITKKKHGGSKVQDSPKEIPQAVTEERHHDDAIENAPNETQVTSKESDAAEVEGNGGPLGLTKLDGDYSSNQGAAEPEAARQQRRKRHKKRKRGGSNKAYDSAKTIPVPLDGSIPHTEDDYDGSEKAQDGSNRAYDSVNPASPPHDGSIPNAEDDGSEQAQDGSYRAYESVNPASPPHDGSIPKVEDDGRAHAQIT